MSFLIENGFILSYTPEDREKAAAVPDGVTGIGQRAFADAALERVTLPEGLKAIEAGAFSGCASLTELDLPRTVQSVSSGAFSGCAALTRVRLPEGMSVYGEHLFSGCPTLRRTEGLESGSWAEYDPRASLLSLHRRGEAVGARLAGCFVDSSLLRSGTVLEALDSSDQRQWAIWIPVGESSADLKEGLRSLLYSSEAPRFPDYDALFRCVKDPRNRLLFALYRLLYPVDLAEEVSIMLRNHLRRGASECVCALIEGGRMAELRAAAKAGFLSRAELDAVLPCAAEHGCEPEIREIFETIPKEESVQNLNAAQVRKLNNPVYARLMARQEKLRRASFERLAQKNGGLDQLLREAVMADDRTKVRYYLSSSILDASVIFDCAMSAVDNGDIYMLQDLIEGMHGVDPMKAGLLLEHAAVRGKTAVVKHLCSSLSAVTAYNRALGYAMRQADFAMADAILSRNDQFLKTARDVREEFVRRMNKPSQTELSRLVIDLGFVEYNYYDDDFRYFFLNNGRNGLVGDEFYDTHYTLVKLADAEDRIAFIHKMTDAGHFTPKALSYLCYLAADADEISIARELVAMGAEDFDVRECSILANQQTILANLGDLFTSNPKRPSDEKFAFIISRLKPGEKLKMQVRYLLKTANASRALAILKHSSLENCEDVPLTIHFFVEHNTLEAVELFCQWGLADEVFEEARAMENTEIVAWILNYQNLHGGREEIEDRFEI